MNQDKIIALKEAYKKELENIKSLQQHYSKQSILAETDSQRDYNNRATNVMTGHIQRLTMNIQDLEELLK